MASTEFGDRRSKFLHSPFRKRPSKSRRLTPSSINFESDDVVQRYKPVFYSAGDLAGIFSCYSLYLEIGPSSHARSATTFSARGSADLLAL